MLQGLSMIGCVMAEDIFLIQSFTGTQENGEEKYRKEQPFGYFYAKSLPSCLEPNEKAGGDAKEIDNGDLFEKKRVKDRDNKIGDKNDKKGR